jgi:aspartate/methionine/tyrosine aminotransferase
MEGAVEIANRKGVKILSDECYSDIAFSKMKTYSSSAAHMGNSFRRILYDRWETRFSITDAEMAKKLTKLTR